MNIRHNPQLNEVDFRLRDNVQSLVEYLRPPSQPPKRQGHQLRYGRKHGLAVVISGRDKGRITPFDGDGKGRSPLQFIQDELHCSFKEAVEWAASWLGLSPDYTPDPETERKREEKRKKEKIAARAAQEAEKRQRTTKAYSIWEATQEAAGSPVEAYLAKRGITVPPPPDIRYLPPRFGSYGAMVAAARDNDGNLTAVQRVFIHNGKKAPIEPAKRTNGVMDGAAVRLPATQGNELVLAEGPETGLSAWQAWGRETWIALGSVVKLVDCMPTDRVVVIARDADEPGSQSDKTLMKAVQTMLERGAEIYISLPPNPTKPKYDFNDALKDYGNEAVSNALARAMSIGANSLPDALPLDEAREILQKTIADFFTVATTPEISRGLITPTPPVWLVNVGLGIGKTTTALKAAGNAISEENFTEGKNR